jgi:hypothetical protein
MLPRSRIKGEVNFIASAWTVMFMSIGFKKDQPVVSNEGEDSRG